MRDSITVLCIADHQNKADLLDPWLANKTIESFHRWLENPERILKLAWIDHEIAGFGMASTSCEILLNYVAPDARFLGVSSSLLSAMEQDLLRSGYTALSLDSTQTAHGFYRARGWQDAGPSVLDGGMQTYPMCKTIGRDA